MGLMLVLVFAILIGFASGDQVYTVGDNSGWTNVGHVDYKTWADTKTFKVGDTIRFVYNKDFHDVTRVTHHNYNSCNSTSPYRVYTSGNDAFLINRPGHFYFICGLPGHCEAGQKVNIRVPHPTAPAPAPAPLPPQSQTPSPVQQQTPSPAPAPPHQHSLSPAPSPGHSGGLALGAGNFWFVPVVLSALCACGIA